jgi:hypothetical protein
MNNGRRTAFVDMLGQGRLLDLKKTVQLAHFRGQKEMENYLLQPVALDRAVRVAVADRAQRTGVKLRDIESVLTELLKITEKHKEAAQSQYVGRRVSFSRGKAIDPATVAMKALREFGPKWELLETRLQLVPGKAVLAELRWPFGGTNHRRVFVRRGRKAFLPLARYTNTNR